MINPFKLDGIVWEDEKQGWSADADVAFRGTGEVAEVNFRKKTKPGWKDKLPYVKVYKGLNPLGLSTPANNMLWWIVCNIKPKQDFITMHDFEFMDAFGYKSPKVYYLGIKELVARSVLAKKGKGEFWVNPNFIFNGNRIFLKRRKNEKD